MNRLEKIIVDLVVVRRKRSALLYWNGPAARLGEGVGGILDGSWLWASYTDIHWLAKLYS